MKDDGTLSALELFRARRKLLEQMDKLEDELNRRRAQDRHIMRAEELE